MNNATNFPLHLEIQQHRGDRDCQHPPLHLGSPYILETRRIPFCLLSPTLQDLHGHRDCHVFLVLRDPLWDRVVLHQTAVLAVQEGPGYHCILVVQEDPEYHCILAAQEDPEYHCILVVQEGPEHHCILVVQEDPEYHCILAVLWDPES